MYRKSSMTSAIVLLVIAALVVFIGYGSSIDGKWFQQSDMSKWYNSWGKGETVQTTDNDQNADNAQNNSQNNSGNQNGNVTPVQTGNNEQMLISDSEGFGLTLLSAPIDGLTLVSLADAPSTYISAYALTVSYTPSSASAPLVDYSVSFENASSTWASGKSAASYVSVIPTTSGALTATAYCLQPFGEKIIITVTCRSDSSLTASVACDFARKVTGLYYEAGVENLPNYLVLKNGVAFVPQDLSDISGRGCFSDSTSASNGHIVPIYSDDPFTLTNSVVSYTCSINANLRFCQELQSAGLSVAVSPGSAFSLSNYYGYGDFIKKFVVGGTFEDQGVFMRSNYNKFLEACQNMGNATAFTVTITADLTYGSASKVFNVSIDSSAAVFLVQQLSPDSAQFVFADGLYGSGIAVPSGAND